VLFHGAIAIIIPILEPSCRIYGSFAPTASAVSAMSSPSSPISDSDPPSTMAPRNLSAGRDVHIYDTKDCTTVLGGLILTNGVTRTNFYGMVEILILFTSSFELQDEGGTTIKRNNDPLQPGKYCINAAGISLKIGIVDFG
jgi:hypothetical protein